MNMPQPPKATRRRQTKTNKQKKEDKGNKHGTHEKFTDCAGAQNFGIRNLFIAERFTVIGICRFSIEFR